MLTQPTIAAQPGKGAFDHPAPGQRVEALDIVSAFDNFQDPAEATPYPAHQRPFVDVIRPDQAQAWKMSRHRAEHQAGTGWVLQASTMHHHHQQQAQCIHHNMAFAPFDALTRIKALQPPFSVVLTLWLSILAALGWASCPKHTRSRSRSTVLTCSHNPLSRQARK